MKQQTDRGRKEVEMEERGQSNVEYKELGVQKKASEEASGLICWSIFHGRQAIIGCWTG